MNNLSGVNALDSESINVFIQSLPVSSKYILAVSGGIDSIVLAHLFSQVSDIQNKNILIVYIDHGLNEHSAEWGESCAEWSKKIGFKFEYIKVNSRPEKGESVEAWARKVRYDCLMSLMQKDAILFTAHHQNDQVETLLLRLFRGAGTRGVSAMQLCRPFSEGLHIRPLLNITRADIRAYADLKQLSCIEDPSNQDIKLDRNYLRHSVLPIINKRWPAFLKTIARFIANQQETSMLLDDVGHDDMSEVVDIKTRTIIVSKLKLLSLPRQKNLLLYFCRISELATPNQVHLQQLLNELLTADEDKEPLVTWSNVEARRYRDRLYIKLSNELLGLPEQSDLSVNQAIKLDDESLKLIASQGKGVKADIINNHKISVRFKKGGEKIKPFNQNMTKTLKQLFQEKGVLPWKRERYPLIYIDDELAVVPGICIAHSFAANEYEAGFIIHWTGFEKVVQSND